MLIKEGGWNREKTKVTHPLEASHEESDIFSSRTAKSRNVIHLNHLSHINKSGSQVLKMFTILLSETSKGQSSYSKGFELEAIN